MTDGCKKDLFEISKKFNEEGPKVGGALFDDLISKYPDKEKEIIRERSQAYASMDLFDDALSDRRVIIEKGADSAADFYFAGECAIQAGYFQEANDYFDEAVKECLSSGSTFYLQSSRLLAGFASYQLHEDDRCRGYLELIDEDVEVLWLKGLNRISKKLLLEAMRRSQSK